jgi:hypothetical protein
MLGSYRREPSPPLRLTELLAGRREGAHEDGTVDQIIEEALAFPHPQPPEAFQRQLAAWMADDTMDRLSEITAPTLVVAGERDVACPPRFDRVVAEQIPGAELIVLGRGSPAVPRAAGRVQRAGQPILDQPGGKGLRLKPPLRRSGNGSDPVPPGDRPGDPSCWSTGSERPQHVPFLPEQVMAEVLEGLRPVRRDP